MRSAHQNFIKLLLIEHITGDAQRISASLSKWNGECSLEHQPSLSTGIARLAQGDIDVALLSLNLPDSTGIATFDKARRCKQQTPIVILSNSRDEELARKAVDRGAEDYLPKSRIDGQNLIRSIRYAIECAKRRRAEHELAAAAEIQRRLLPSTTPKLPGLDIAGRCDPAQWAGGDFFDFFSTPDDTLWTVVGDVCGHGTGAALMMSATRAIIRSLAKTQRRNELGGIMSSANVILCDDLGGDSFVTLNLTTLNARTGRLKYAIAGQPGFVLNRAGDVTMLHSDHPPIGIDRAEKYTSRQVHLGSGRIFTVFTDGISQRHSASDEQFGSERALETLRRCQDESAAQMIEHLFSAAAAFAGTEVGEDDMTSVVVKPFHHPAGQ